MQFAIQIQILAGFLFSGTSRIAGSLQVSSGEKISTADCYDGDPKHNPHGKRFREICGALRWLEQCTRLDISARLSELCKVQANPGRKHVEEITRLMNYIATTCADTCCTRSWMECFGHSEVKKCNWTG